MLLGKYGGGNQHRHLFPVHNRLEGRPHRHLGFAVAHVAAQQPVHWPFSFHIPFCLFNAPQLVGGFLVGEQVIKLLLPYCIRAEGVSFSRFPGSVKLQQFPCHALYGLLYPGLGFCPFPAPHFVYAYLFALGTDVLLYKVGLVGGKVQHIAAPVLNL